MAILNVRNLPDHVHRNIRIRAARNGRSMEAEVRTLLINLFGGGEQAGAEELQCLVEQLYPEGLPKGVVDDLIAERRKECERE